VILSGGNWYFSKADRSFFCFLEFFSSHPPILAQSTFQLPGDSFGFYPKHFFCFLTTLCQMANSRLAFNLNVGHLTPKEEEVLIMTHNILTFSVVNFKLMCDFDPRHSGQVCVS